jgi:hypothetical protein
MSKITFRDLGKQGRLGNQLFQIAAVLQAANTYGMDPVFPEWEYNKYLETPLNIETPEVTHFYKEPDFAYRWINLSESLCRSSNADIRDKVYTLSGYFQSELYFRQERTRQAFKFKEEIVSKMKEKLLSYGNYQKYCSIHVRRGDYVGLSYYHQLDLDYYINAMNSIAHLGKPLFVVFSDDIHYTKMWFQDGIISALKPNIDMVFVEGNTDIEDLVMMSLCHNHIIANSTFSWWGSWLSDYVRKQVIFPPKWFGESANLDESTIRYNLNI